jgi:hypothetical protein
MFSRLPNDVIVKMALTLELPEILRLCGTEKRFNKIICENKNF